MKALSPLLVYKSSLTKQDIFTLVEITTLVVLQTIIEIRQHADYEFKRPLKLPAKIWHSFRYLDFFHLFLHICFCNFEVKIARFIKVYVQRKRLMKFFLGLTTHLKCFFFPDK